MMQRRTNSNHNGPILPLTKNDPSPKLKQRRGKKRKGGKSSFTLCKIVLAMVVVGGLIAVGVIHQEHLVGLASGVSSSSSSASRTLNEERNDKAAEDLILGKFPSLRWPLDNSEIVALYFAAKWCPDSTPVTKLLDETFRDILVEPPESDNAEDLLQRGGISLVYVSSDMDEQRMQSYRKSRWQWVRFHGDERSNLKRFFKTCAHKEMAALDIDERDRGIPSLIIVSGQTHEVLTYDGVHDLKERGAQAVDYWMELNDVALGGSEEEEQEQESGEEENLESESGSEEHVDRGESGEEGQGNESPSLSEEES